MKKILVMLIMVCLLAESVELNALAEEVDLVVEEADLEETQASGVSYLYQAEGFSLYYQSVEDGVEITRISPDRVTDIVIPEEINGEIVISIGDNACYDVYETRNLTSIILPNGLKRIGYRAFGYCKKMTDIYIPESVTSIGEEAFIGCDGLTNITITGNVNILEKYVFAYCDGLTNVVIPEGVSAIEWGAFAHCEALTSVSIPGSVSSIGEFAFDNCTSLTDVSISQGVNIIGSFAFEDCSKLTVISIPDSVTEIEARAFERCRELKSIALPNGLEKIGDYAFYDCSGLISLFIPAKVWDIGLSVFDGCSGLTSIAVDSNNQYYDSRENCNAIIETRLNRMILGCQNTVIPESVEELFGAFSSCTGLTSIYIPKGITKISGGEFSKCSNLTNIIVDINNQYYDGIGDCNGIIEKATGTLIRGTQNTVIPENVWKIGIGAFSDLNNITQITIPEGVGWIDRSAFRNCSDLTTINIPKRVTKIEAMAFEGCSSLESIIIPENVTEIEAYAFEGCSSLESINIPENVTEIGEAAFQNCSSLTSLCIPEGVETIWGNAFYGCSSLESVILPEENVLFMGLQTFKDCSSLKSIRIPKGTSGINYRMFEGCSNLTDVSIPDSLFHIDDWAFSGCSSLTSICLPEGFRDMGSRVFDGCDNLKKITNLSDYWLYLPTPSTDNAYWVKEGEEDVSITTISNGTAILKGIAPENSSTPTNPFVDVAEGNYYYDAVLWAVNHNPQITNGTSATTFNPQATCTRGQVVTFLWRAAGCPEPTGSTNPFTDVAADAYYYKAVLWAVEKGITNGTGASTFSPGKPCTRGQVVTFLYRFENMPTSGNMTNPFTDVKEGAYYYDAVLWAVNHTPQITNGTSATTFNPEATCTRGQIVTFLYRDLGGK